MNQASLSMAHIRTLEDDHLFMHISKILSSQLKNGMSFKEVFRYQEVSFWWFFRQFCYNILRDYEVENRVDVLNILLGRLYLLTNSFFVCVLSAFFAQQRPNRHNEKVVIISPQAAWRSIRPLDPRAKSSKIDHNFHDLMSITQDRFDFVGLNDSQWLLLGDFKRFLEKKRDEECLWKPLERFMTLSALLTAWRCSRKLEREWHHMRKEDSFMRFFKQWNVDKSHSLRIDFFFRFVIFQQILYIELMKRAIDFEKPKLILISQEYTGQGMAAVIAGKLRGIPTIAFQHGIITCTHPGYFHLREEISSKFSPDHAIIADKTAVYGMFSRDVLTNCCNYPVDAVVVTGSPRYDSLVQAEKVFSKKRTLERYGLSFEKKTALLITQSFSMSHSFLRVAVRALKNLPSVQTIIKPHPNDVHYEWHKRILEEENYEAIVAEPFSDTFELLFACDAMMTVTSTVAIEAMLLKKFVIVVNLIGMNDPMPYAESGAALGVYEENDVEPTIKKVFFEASFREELETKMERFVEYHVLYGNATKNVVKLIKEVIRN